jgi:hypothetical protein
MKPVLFGTARTRAFHGAGLVLLLLGVTCTGLAEAQGAASCWTSPGGMFWTTIVLKTDDRGLCVVDQYGGTYAATIRTRPGESAVWHVCNACSDKADVRLSNFSTQMTTLLPYMRPPADSSNSVTVRDLPVDMNWSVINAAATADQTYMGMHDYEIFVKLSSEAETKWRRFHPQLQIDRDGIFTKKLIISLGIGGFLIALIAFLLGRRLVA